MTCACLVQGFHRPIYTSSLEGVTLASDLAVATDLRNSWETIFYQYEVRILCILFSRLVRRTHACANRYFPTSRTSTSILKVASIVHG